MTADASAYAVLGVDPGADSAEIEQAYKRLIKQHHPDRSGGDPARAAAITGAYRELRSMRNLRDPLELNDDEFGPRRAGRAWLLLFALILAVGSSFLLLEQGPLAPLVQDYASRLKAPPSSFVHGKAVPRIDPMERSLNEADIMSAVREASRLSRTKDEMALAGVSRNCHRALRSDPSLQQLDRCAAFDATVIALQDRDPLRDQGPFSEIDVTGRIRAGASELSDDPVAIDGRVERIRRKVAEALAPGARDTR
jgi:hypothetical protein